MSKRRTKLIQEGQFAAEVEVELIESEDAWAPYLSLEDAAKLDRVRQALRQGNLAEALTLGRIYRLTPITRA
jgi:hypothetical protein